MLSDTIFLRLVLRNGNHLSPKDKDQVILNEIADNINIHLIQTLRKKCTKDKSENYNLMFLTVVTCKRSL